MYQNHHEDNRYRDHHDVDPYTGRLQEHTDFHDSDDYRADEQYSEERYQQAYFSEQASRHEPFREEPFFEAHCGEEPYADENRVEGPLRQRGYDDESFQEGYYNEEGFVEEPFVEEFYAEVPFSEEPFSEEPFSEEPFVEAQFRDEHYDETLYTEDYHGPEINEYTQDRAGALYAEDFDDAIHRTSNRFFQSLGKIGIGLAIALFAISFAVITVFASKPQMTPEEIVQMKGYKGPARDRTVFFNLASLRDCNNIDDDCDGVVKASLPNSSSQSDSTIEPPAQSTAYDSLALSSNYREVPAVAAPATQASSTNADKSNQWKVRQQWSIVRETPARNGAIITSLVSDQHVTVIRKIGEWWEISTDDESTSVPLGFIHSSLLQPI